MDLETENRLAALLMEEARRLRLQADKEGVNVYLRQPTVRGRPNSRFLTATVLGVQQANRAVEVNEMWRAREKEVELDNRLMGRSKDKARARVERNCDDALKDIISSRHEEGNMNAVGSSSSSRHEYGDCFSIEDGGLRDEEVEKFLHSRAKRGRGAVGSRMDEPGPYLTHISDNEGQLLANPDVRVQEEWERRVIGPEKPPSMKSHDLSGVHTTKRIKKDDVSSSKKQHSEKHRSKEKNPSKNKRKEKKSKHRHGSR